MMLLLGIGSLLVAGCMANVVPETSESKLAHATNDLGFELLKTTSNDKNAFISPFSISTALAMVYLGAGGTTAQALRRVMKYEKYGLSEHDVHATFHSLLTKVSNRDDFQLSSYNHALVQKDFSILQTYEEALSQYYSAAVESVDFETQGQQVKENINANVERATRDKIKDFLDSPPSIDTKLFLLNAVYFLGNWEEPFNARSTFPGSFYNNGVQEKQVDIMSRDGFYKYVRSSDLNATFVVLPYNGTNTASMVIALPNSKTGVAELQQNITQESLDLALNNARGSRVIFSLPKFSLEYSTELSDKLSLLGLSELFTNANLSRIAGPAANLFVSKVSHKAAIDVDEKGTRAAAATGIEISLASLPPIIRVDHPFLFFIRDDSNGMILFTGRVDEL